jgi:hypothetical protein
MLQPIIMQGNALNATRSVVGQVEDSIIPVKLIAFHATQGTPQPTIIQGNALNVMAPVSDGLMQHLAMPALQIANLAMHPMHQQTITLVNALTVTRPVVGPVRLLIIVD